MQVAQYPAFEKAAKKLHANAKQDLDNAINHLIENPLLGELKKGDLAGIRVYKFQMVRQLTLLAYVYEESESKLLLHALGSHENFYRDLKGK
jgi:mRNA-degrading endonuclease YafQ of YafQ-DinJ toxin-antitoxin module